jgi:ABC-2 type transport system ATP-binding protein
MRVGAQLKRDEESSTRYYVWMNSPLLPGPAIALRDVTKLYPGPVKALDSVTLEVARGELCCLLGPNGAGKTTIIRLLQGAVSATAGSVSILGADVRGAGIIDAKRQIGIVPQSPGMYPDLTVREYLTFVRDLYARGDVEATARDCGLDTYLDRTLSTLSGGYQRRLLVGAAVISEPSLLLLDEPTVGLDPIAAADTRRLLRSTMAGRTVLMSTHNLAEAEELCDTVIILRQGKVLVHERIEDLRRQAAPRVHLAASQGRDALGSALTALQLSWSPNEHGVWLHLVAPEGAMPAVLRSLLGSGIDIYECRIVPPTLEDLFVEVVTRT